MRLLYLLIFNGDLLSFATRTRYSRASKTRGTWKRAADQELDELGEHQADFVPWLQEQARQGAFQQLAAENVQLNAPRLGDPSRGFPPRHAAAEPVLQSGLEPVLPNEGVSQSPVDAEPMLNNVRFKRKHVGLKYPKCKVQRLKDQIRNLESELARSEAARLQPGAASSVYPFNDDATAALRENVSDMQFESGNIESSLRNIELGDATLDQMATEVQPYIPDFHNAIQNFIAAAALNTNVQTRIAQTAGAVAIAQYRGTGPDVSTTLRSAGISLAIGGLLSLVTATIQAAVGGITSFFMNQNEEIVNMIEEIEVNQEIARDIWEEENGPVELWAAQQIQENLNQWTDFDLFADEYLPIEDAKVEVAKVESPEIDPDPDDEPIAIEDVNVNEEIEEDPISLVTPTIAYDFPPPPYIPKIVLQRIKFNVLFSIFMAGLATSAAIGLKYGKKRKC